MRVIEIKKIVLSSEEYNNINNALDIVCEIAKDSQTMHIVNSQLPCGYGIEDIRDSLQYLTDIVEVE